VKSLSGETFSERNSSGETSYMGMGKIVSPILSGPIKKLGTAERSPIL